MSVRDAARLSTNHDASSDRRRGREDGACTYRFDLDVHTDVLILLHVMEKVAAVEAACCCIGNSCRMITVTAVLAALLVSGKSSIAGPDLSHSNFAHTAAAALVDVCIIAISITAHQ